MISSMGFGVPVVRDFLKDTGHVLTVRGYNYKTTAATVPDLDGIRIKRKKLGEIKTEKDLIGFVSLSGFKNVADWMEQIRRFCKGKMYLYRVSIDETKPAPVRHAKRMPTACHPFDIRNDPGMRDPALVDLDEYKEQAHADRLETERRAAARRRERMRKKYRENTKMPRPPRSKDILMVTGNRHLKDSESIRRQLNALIDEHRPDIAISGMAIGTDQLFVEICIEKGISVWAYIPFQGQDSRWPARVQKRYKELLQQCEKKVIVCDSASIAAFQTRNVAMVHASTRAIAVRDYKPGGTENCIKVLDRESKPYVTVENRTVA